MRKLLRFVLFSVVFGFYQTFSQAAQVEEKSYQDLIQELNWKKSRIDKLNRDQSLNQKSMSLGLVSSYNQISHPKIQSAQLQGFEVGFSNDLGQKDLEGRVAFRYFFNNSSLSSQDTSLRELALQLAKKRYHNRHWNILFGGGFSVRHLLASSSNTHINESSIQLNALTGLETSLSPSSYLSFEGATRFPFGVSGQDKLSLDFSIRLKTEIE